MEEKNKNNTAGFEKCVLCGKLTDIPLDMPISKREGYVETAGQLCRKCYFETYVKKSSR